MGKKKQLWTGIIAAIGFFMLLIDTKTALHSAQEGISLCISTVIPSLFPFFVLSSFINTSLLGKKIRMLHPICKICNIPQGAESLLILGFLGGYPIGAQCISDAYVKGALKKSDAQRMLGFCSNSGPAFIFGMIGSLFSRPLLPWILWLLHILSALLVGCILPRNVSQSCTLSDKKPLTISNILRNCLSVMASVCGWVVLFRVVIGFCEHWFLWFLPESIQACFSGILELSNGCFSLQNVTSDGIRFVLCAGMLGFGGICVGMQTISVTNDLGTGMYFPGKILHGLISIIAAVILQQFLFSGKKRFILHPILLLPYLIITTGIIFTLYRKKKVVAISC